MTGKEIQAAVYQDLTNFFDPTLIIKEWSVRKGAADAFGDSASYAPRLDIAVGPFNLTFQDRASDADAIRNFSFRHPLIQWLNEEIRTRNNGGFYVNHNPRCLLAIEVEHSTSSKHILGAITNASMLGLLGVVIGSSVHIAKVRRIHAYACKLKEVGKAHDDMFGNVACFEEAEFLDLLPSLYRTRGSIRETR
jgi:hypothetical protein